MLERIGDEVARATSIVRYAANSRFLASTHGGGEEFLVLGGVFEDEHGDFPAGSYEDATWGRTGGWREVGGLQFDPKDRNEIRLDTGKMAYRPAPGRARVDLMPLFAGGPEEVRLER